MNKEIKNQIAKKALLHSNEYDSSFCDSLEFLYQNLSNEELLEITLEAQEIVLSGEVL
jgi:hypothetical protein